jgi:DNA polymerase III epsilon subunit family exonuclease
MNGILDLKLAETPISVIDFETTGLTAGVDRAVEVSVVRIDPKLDTYRVVFDSLINPQRKMDATNIHGITDNDVSDAPTFQEIIPDFLNVISGTVVTSYNIEFDIKFLKFEMENAEIFIDIPHFCIMYLRNIFRGSVWYKLHDACREYGIMIKNEHHSFDDTVAAAQLLLRYLLILQHEQNDILFRDLVQKCDAIRSSDKDYKFWDSFNFNLVPSPSEIGLKTSKNKIKSRSFS